MNRPPLPTTLSAKRTRRPGQNLTSLAPGPRGAVLLPVIPKIPQSQSWTLVKRTNGFGEDGKNFIPHFILLKFLHPPHWPSRRKHIPLANRGAKNARKINHQNGRERPHFFGFNPPKKFLRSLPPVSEVRHDTPPDGNHRGLERITRPTDSQHTDLNDFRIKACMAGPQEGEASQCPS